MKDLIDSITISLEHGLKIIATDEFGNSISVYKFLEWFEVNAKSIAIFNKSNDAAKQFVKLLNIKDYQNEAKYIMMMAKEIYGDDPNSFGGQRDGFIKGYNQCLKDFGYETN